MTDIESSNSSNSGHDDGRDRDGVEVPAYDVGDGVHWIVWCDWCVMWHRYGAEEGDRAAHCFDDTGSPYRRMRYVLQYAGPLTNGILAQHANELRRGDRARRQWMKLRGDSRAVEWRDVYEGRIGTVKSPSGMRRLTPAEDLARGLMLLEALGTTNAETPLGGEQ